MALKINRERTDNTKCEHIALRQIGPPVVRRPGTKHQHTKRFVETERIYLYLIFQSIYADD